MLLKSLANGLRVLEFVLASDRPVRTTDVAERLDLDKSAASRVLHTLAASGFTTQTADRRYVPGPKLAARNGSSALDLITLREAALPLLGELVERSQETAHLAILAGDRVLYLEKISAPQTLRVDHPVGTLAPLHCTALGKVLLAWRAAPVPAALAGYTARTVRDPDLLEAQLRRIVKDGYATDDEEYAAGVRCAAAPLFDGARVVAAIGLSGPASRIDLNRLAELGALVKRTAQRFKRGGNGRGGP